MNRMNQPLVMQQTIRSEITQFDAAVNNVNLTTSNQLNQLTNSFGTLKEDFGQIEEIVADAENAVNSITSASFPLMEREHPILCLKVKKHEPGEENEGRLFVTDQRLLYETEKEVVLEKKWFVVTKKKMDRVLDLEVPLGLITEAHKGRVGFMAWDGVYVEIKPGQKYKQAIFDTHGEDAEKLVGAIDYVLSGQADKDRVLTEAIEKPPEGIKAFFCVKCGAPLNVLTTRGIAEVNCMYCGTKNKIQ